MSNPLIVEVERAVNQKSPRSKSLDKSMEDTMSNLESLEATEESSLKQTAAKFMARCVPVLKIVGLVGIGAAAGYQASQYQAAKKRQAARSNAAAEAMRYLDAQTSVQQQPMSVSN